MEQELSSYLKKLTFDRSLSKSFSAGLLTNFRVIVLLIIGIVVAGLFSLFNLPRRINPEVNIPIVFVSTIFPGAGPEEVERQITVPIEEAIEGIEGIDQVSSTSSDNASFVVIEFTSRVDLDQATNDVMTAVDGVTGLPQDAMEPKVMPLNFEDVPVVTFALTTTADPVSLQQFSRQLQDKLETLPQVQKVNVSGLERTEVEVLVKPDTYATYRISPIQLQQAIHKALATYPSGSVTTDGSRLSLTVEVPTAQLVTLRTLPVNLGSTTVVLGTIASISIRSAPEQINSFYADPNTEAEPTVSFSVFKTVSADLEATAAVAKDTLNQALAESGNRYQAVMVSDFEADIEEQFGDLIKDFSTSIALVFITLFIFLGIRQATIASLVIPLSFFATFAAMYWYDIQLSFLSLFSLLLGLGMIVDDTIVMISAMTDYYASGKFSPKETGLLVWRDYLAPTLSSNLTNIWSFLPLLIATGIIGEFTKVISIVVTIALVGSTAIALIITIPLMMVVLKPRIPRRVGVFVGFLTLLAVSGLMVGLLVQNPLLPFIVIAYLLLLAVLGIGWPLILTGVKAKILLWFSTWPFLNPALLTNSLYKRRSVLWR